LTPNRKIPRHRLRNMPLNPTKSAIIFDFGEKVTGTCY